MLHAVIAAIQSAHINAYGLQVPFGQGIVGMVQYTFVEGHMSRKGMRPQAVDAQDVVYIVVRTFYPIVYALKGAVCLIVIYGFLSSSWYIICENSEAVLVKN